MVVATAILAAVLHFFANTQILHKKKNAKKLPSRRTENGLKW
jgi:hypothetical protein